MTSLTGSYRTFLISIIILLGSANVESVVRVSTQDLDILVHESATFTVEITNSFREDVFLRFEPNHEELLRVEPHNYSIPANTSGPRSYTFTVFAEEAGHTVLSATLTPKPQPSVDLTEAFVRVTNLHSKVIYHVSAVIGWVYFVAWSISFYPQIYENWKRKSVIGLNFDFLALNIIGFFLYSLFNCGLYWIPAIENDYFERYPKGTNPVLMNDIFFALHATFATIITIVQCFLYERGSQTVSWTARIIIGVFAVFLVVSAILASTVVITWLDFLYYCSYVKLTITLIKYVPQAYMNYKRKSTQGWSIGNIFLDFTGGMLSMLQMILNAHNYNDWASIFGDPTKFGLGLFSVFFDIFFIIQHYLLYRIPHPDCYVEVNGENQPRAPRQETEDEQQQQQHTIVHPNMHDI